MNKYSSIDFNPFDGQEIQKICLANESQREIWLSCIFGGETASLAYNLSLSLYFKGVLNRPALQKSIADLILLHEGLRANFSADGAKLIIYEDFPIELVVKDISPLDDLQKNETIREYIREEGSNPFDLENGPLLRLCLHQLDAETNVLTLTTHHIIVDGWSLNVFVEDLGRFYAINSGGQAQKELDPPFQISAYSEESIAFKETKAFSDNENYWLQLYKDGIPESNLPTDYPRNPTRSYQGERIDLSLSQEFSADLKSFSKKSECSLVTFLLSAFEVYLAKITDQDQLVVGIFSSGRPEAYHANMIAHSVNLLPLKASINQQDSFKNYLKQKTGEVLDAVDHQAFTFSELIKKLYIPRDSSRVPLVPIVFNFENEFGSDASFDKLTFHSTSNPREYENFELNLNILWQKDIATLQWAYNKDLFKRDTIAKMAEQFAFFLAEVMKNPSAKIQDLLVEDPQATLARISERNATFVPFSKQETLLSYFDRMVAMYPQKTAISFQAEQLSFEDLSRQTNQLAHILIENGIKKGDNVGIALSRSPKVVISMLAVLKCGGVYIPLDPDFPHDRIVYMLENSFAKALITSEEFKDRFKSEAKELFIEDCWRVLDSYPDQAPDCPVTGEDLAYVLYTSGSTGKPKGVQIRHYNLLNFLLSMQKEPGIQPSDKWLAITTVSFDIAGLEIFLPLISGAQIVLADEGLSRDGAAILSIIKDQGITILQATPATWTMMLYESWEEKLPLKVLCGGEAFPKSLAQKLLNRSAEVWNMYGPTETTIWSTVKRLSLDDEIITVGRPIDNTLIYILDEKLNMVPEGSVGEIYIAGDGLALGYMNRPDLTLEKFIDNPFEPAKSAKIYGTGDLGIALENGEIQCLGRLDHQVKIRGFRIELGEIEHALSQADSVKEAIVIAREDQLDDKRLCAYVIPNLKVDRAMETALKTIWRQKLKETLPPYMLPNDYVFLTKFPLTPNGKIDRKQLPKPGSAVIQETESEPEVLTIPNTAIAQTIATVWAESLGVSEINMGDDFFQLGGHSLLAVQLMMRIEKETGKKVPLTSLFKFSTFESFVRLYEDPESKEIMPPTNKLNEVQLNDEEIIVPTTESQKEIWLSCVIGGDKANLAYNLPSALKMDGNLNLEAFRKAITVLINRHEALRINISASGESLSIHPQLELSLDTIDFSMLNPQEQERRLKTFIRTEMNKPFNLSEGPLFRMYLHRLGDNSHYFTLITHHIICDGGSIDILFDELSQLYNAYTDGHDLILAPAPQMSNYVLDLLTFNNSNDYHLTQQYWLDQYKNNVPVLDLPVDQPRVPNKEFKGEQLEFLIENETFHRIVKLSRESKCSMVTTLLSAFELFLYVETQQKDVVVGLPVSGQTGSFFGLVGHCVNLLPIRSEINNNESFTEYLKRRTSQIYSDYDHQKLTFGELLKNLNMKRDPTRVPLIPVMFSMRGDQDIEFTGLKHKFEEHALVAQTFELSLYVTQCGDKLELTWVYNPNLFKKERIESFHLDFVAILSQMGANPDLKIKNLRKHEITIEKRVTKSLDDSNNGQSSFSTASTMDMQSLVADVWAKHLNIPDMDVKSDFFEQGGHSMMAVKIMTEIEKRTGRKLPLSILFENSTIESLSEVIVNDTQKPKWQSLVPIKTTGNKTPIYLIHGWGLNVLVFRTLSEFLDADQPVYGIQAQGLNGEKINSLNTVEKLAKHFNAELLSKNPNGPYIIAGYSFGGIIAFEMAKQLMALGKEIKMLGILDTYATSGYSTDSKVRYFLKKGLRQFYKAGFFLKSFLNNPKETLAYQRYILATKLNGTSAEEDYNDHKDDSIEAEILRNYDQAYNTYHLTPSAINIDLFRVKERLYYLDDPKYLAWNKYANEGVTVHEIPGDHKTFLFSPNVEQLAKVIQDAINARNLE